MADDERPLEDGEEESSDSEHELSRSGAVASCFSAYPTCEHKSRLLIGRADLSGVQTVLSGRRESVNGIQNIAQIKHIRAVC